MYALNVIFARTCVGFGEFSES